jgi:uncharacterized RDD family membrane protein YckC
MAAISIPTAFNISLEFEVSPFGRRLIAWIIDTSLQALYCAGFISLFLDGDLYFSDSMETQAAFVLFCVLPVSSYHFVMEVFCKGQSLGKMATGIRVVDMMGGEPSVSQYLIRLLFRSFSLIPLLGAIIADVMGKESVLYNMVLALVAIAIFVMFLTSKYSQRLGDRLAGTLVIRNRAEANINTTIFLEVSDTTYTVRYPEVMKLSDRDLNGIRNLLAVKSTGKDAMAYTERISTRVQQVLGITTEQEPRQFLEQLLWDYNYLTKG